MRLKLNANPIENCIVLPTFQELQVKKFVKREAGIENGNILQEIPAIKQMKTRLLFLLLITSQLVIVQRGLEVGPWVQYQSTWILNKNDMDAGGQMDYKETSNSAYGVEVSYGITKKHGIRSGIIRSVQGQLFTTAEDFLALPNFTYETILEYFQIPLQYRYSSNLSKKKSAFTFNFGPQFGLLKRARIDSLIINQLTSNVTVKENLDALQLFSETDIGISLGIGCARRLGKRIILKTGLNLSYSLQDIEVAKFKPANRGSSQNAVAGVHFGLFYLFRKIE